MKTENLTSYLFRHLIITVLSIIAPISGEPGLPTNSALSAADPKDEPPAAVETFDAARLLNATINRIERLQTISAEISLKIVLFDEEFVGTGRYEELAALKNARKAGGFDPLTTSRFRLHIKMPPPASAALAQELDDNVLEIVCDQNSLWTYTSIEGEQRLTEINLTEMTGFLGQLSESERQKLADSGVVLPASMGNFPSLGGVAGTLAALKNWYDFDPTPAQMFFNSGTFPVWKITGRMKPERVAAMRKRLLGANEEGDRSLLDHLPTGVDVYIGQKTPFPFRIAYYNVTNEDKNLHKSLVTLDFTRVYENVTSINANSFVYAPKINSERITKKYLQELIPGVEL